MDEEAKKMQDEMTAKFDQEKAKYDAEMKAKESELANMQAAGGGNAEEEARLQAEIDRQKA